MAPRRRRWYNVRDLLGHFVKPRSMREKMCPHACCRGKRVHPANFPVILPRKLLREATDRELVDHYGKHANNGNARRQLEAEMERRDRVEARRRISIQASSARRFARLEDEDRRLLAAERATSGYMVNERGKRIGMTPRRLLTSRRDAERYGTDELRAFLDAEDRGAGRLSQSRRETAGGAYKRSRTAAGQRATAARVTDAESYLNPDHRINRRLAARRAR